MRYEERMNRQSNTMGEILIKKNPGLNKEVQGKLKRKLEQKQKCIEENSSK